MGKVVADFEGLEAKRSEKRRFKIGKFSRIKVKASMVEGTLVS